MKTKKWISELHHGELFTILPNESEVLHYFVALGGFDSISKFGYRTCVCFNDLTTRYDFANVQVYSLGILVTKL